MIPVTMQKIPLAALLALALLSGCKTAEEKAETHYEDGLELIEAGDVDRALVEFRNVFRLNPAHREARRAYAEAVLGRGDEAEAYGQYLRLVEQYPDDAPARLALAEIAVARQDWDEAERHVPRAVRLNPDAPRARAAAATLAYRDALEDKDRDAREAAAADALDLLDTLPDNLPLSRVAIDAAMQAGDDELALDRTGTAIDRHPDELALWRIRLMLLARLGREDEAGAVLAEMTERFPDDEEIAAARVDYHVSRGETAEAEAFLREVADPARPDDAAYVTLIRLIAETEGAAAAAAEIDADLAGAPEATHLRALKADLLWRTGDAEGAIAELRTLTEGAEATPEIDRARVSLAGMLDATGDRDGADALVAAVLEHDPSQTDALKMQAARLIADDDTDTAIARLRTVLDQSPSDTAAMTLMAEAHLRAGNRALARDMLALAADVSGGGPDETLRYVRLLTSEERWSTAEASLVDALRRRPENVPMLAELGRVRLADGDDRGAAEVVRRLRALGTDEAEAALAAIEVPRLAREKGRDEAVALIEELASGVGARLDARVALARARIAEGDLEGARAVAEAAAADGAAGRLLVAAVDAAAGDVDAAEAGLRALADEGELGAQPWLSLARLLSREGRGPEARAALDEGLGKHPGIPDLLWAKASFLERDGDADGAIAIYEDLYAEDSSSVVVANNLASLLAVARDDDESLERAWRIARRLKGTEVPNFQDTYGWIAFRRGRTDEALDYLEPAAAGLPGDAVVQAHYAEALEAAGRDEDALAVYRRAVEAAAVDDMRPGVARAREAVERLTTGALDTDALPAPGAEDAGSGTSVE